MTVQTNFAPSGRANEAFLRIALPSFRLSARNAEPPQPRGPDRDSFKQLLDVSLTPADLIHLKLTRAERRQIAAARRVRAALYDTTSVS